MLAYFEPHVPIMNAIADRLDDFDMPFIDLPWFTDEDAEAEAEEESEKEVFVIESFLI